MAYSISTASLVTTQVYVRQMKESIDIKIIAKTEWMNYGGGFSGTDNKLTDIHHD